MVADIFLELVRNMREAQKAYFESRKSRAMALAIHMEKQVDMALEAIYQQPELFQGELSPPQCRLTGTRIVRNGNGQGEGKDQPGS